MAAEIITKEDLQEFGERLLSQMKALISGKSNEEPRKFLKSYQVKNLLKISNNTLQTLRDNGTLPFTKIGGILYYNYEDIMKVLKGEVKSKRISFTK
ncbi:DNA-binding protein [Mucilaginibacter sp. MD40]|uniref:helix-turn-helix domain-containing protein n=1 Tax=Mucilaginibacter sp. MD40 TaxID=2029590 RepID=UPI000BACCDDD|nr:helix-turn-helix domain-containing protein [Mucilaginibacter sp. MD40]PAW92345.1 DNA-binding protein [Mucilaginibacter sp. MD40]